MSKRIELLSPAGDMECFNSALNFGADAVYLAGKEFGMRTSSKNFSINELKTAVKTAHEKNAKVYVTCNTIAWNEEINRLPEAFEELASADIDAFIIADLGVLQLAKKYAPNVAVHISTQAGIVNYAAANAFYELGAKRVVLARELPLTEIEVIRKNTPEDLEIECFVHGAMCVSFSGRCIISSAMTGRDANRGDCAQPCRWKYHLYEENREGQFFPVEEADGGTYLYNSRDLCMIEHIPELIKAGVTSFKIEGRAKSAYYTAVTTNAYRKAIDAYELEGDDFKLPIWIKEELDKISHREYSTGFYFGNEPGQVTENGGYIRNYEVVAVCEGFQNGESKVTQRNRFFTGDEVDVLPINGIPFCTKILEIRNQWDSIVDSAPHAMEKLTVKTETPIFEGAILRKRR
ncbi:MAG: U32 family peptidase [Bacillota bacterium]|nr:U32 family peptidase [Bacillota bacterium]